MTSLRRRPTALAALLLAAPLVACGDDAAPSAETAAAAERNYGNTGGYGDTGSDTGNDAGNDTANETADDSLVPAVGADMLAGLAADLIGGGRLDLSDYADEPLLLWFWAPF